jgi:hypothetical protein
MPDPDLRFPMQHERLTPGAHLRKNTKQILAMLRASAVRAGLGCEFEQPASTKAQAELTVNGQVRGRIEVRFTTDGIEANLVPASDPAAARQALALYTDTGWMMEELEQFLAAIKLV